MKNFGLHYLQLHPQKYPEQIVHLNFIIIPQLHILLLIKLLYFILLIFLLFINKKAENSFQQVIINTIQNNSKKKVKQKEKIYRSLDDGLTFQAIQNVIIGQENLLWFFKSSNNNGTVFGGFTPYQWQIACYSGNEIENPSFLFSETLKEIYPIIQSKGNWTQWFEKQYIIFGGTANYDQDLRINTDFKSGYSRLGIGYQAPVGVDTSKYSTHLFGALEPNVIECEIYKIIFE
ncbi:unnamed protein product [Paramecium sonneborni]|uniref:TLDc domain-containing protein n=1 Tax=Paramecium sonneborni TaxID=65129 RepID=A0A8S1RC16_9CILI|nr:unnamed protein product [Paramecium sonneborni]